MSAGDIGREQALSVFRDEVLRWNQRFSLISRQDSPARLDALMAQSAEAFAALGDEYPNNLGPEARVLYFDLGSGGGIPGFSWHLALHDCCKDLRSWFVEPRDKRAWFLERLATMTGQENLEVLACRWGEAEAVVPEAVRAPDLILVSMKALHLPDREVLKGLEEALGSQLDPASGRLLIARFYPPDAEWAPALARDLEIPDPGTIRNLAGRRWVAGGGCVLKSANDLASLVVSDYQSSLEE